MDEPPTDRPLDWGAWELVQLTEIGQEDIERAVALWRASVRGTRLEGLLGAADRDG